MPELRKRTFAEFTHAEDKNYVERKLSMKTTITGRSKEMRKTEKNPKIGIFPLKQKQKEKLYFLIVTGNLDNTKRFCLH